MSYEFLNGKGTRAFQLLYSVMLLAFLGPLVLTRRLSLHFRVSDSHIVLITLSIVCTLRAISRFHHSLISSVQIARAPLQRETALFF